MRRDPTEKNSPVPHPDLCFDLFSYPTCELFQAVGASFNSFVDLLFAEPITNSVWKAPGFLTEKPGQE